MNIMCVICNLHLLVQSNNAVNAPCGHIFHKTCLLQWLQRSQTCPQCRGETTEHTIRTMYFTFSDDNDSIVDAKSLQNEFFDDLSFQLYFKNIKINNLIEIKKVLEEQISHLKREVKNIERELNSKNAANHALQTQINFFEQQFIQLNKYKKAYEELQEKVKNLYIGFSKDFKSKVDGMIDRIFDHANFVTYIRVLRERTANLYKRKKLQFAIRSLQQKLRESNKKIEVLKVHNMQKEWEKKLNMCAPKKILLQAYDNLPNKYCICNNVFVENQNYMRSNFEKYGKTSGKEHVVKATYSEATYSKLHIVLQDNLNLKENSCIIIELDNNDNKLMRRKEKIDAKNKRLKLENILEKISLKGYLEKNIVSRYMNIEPDNNDKKLMRQKENIDAKNKRLKLENILKKIKSNLKRDSRYINIEPDNGNIKSESFCLLRNCDNRALKRSYTQLKISSILPKKLKLIQLNHETDLENFNEWTL